MKMNFLIDMTAARLKGTTSSFPVNQQRQVFGRYCPMNQSFVDDKMNRYSFTLTLGECLSPSIASSRCVKIYSIDLFHISDVDDVIRFLCVEKSDVCLMVRAPLSMEEYSNASGSG